MTLPKDARYRAAQTLHQGGIHNPARVVRLIRDTIASQGVDLSGLTVLTEAASGAFVVTPVIAALAGAERVIALTCDSPYGSAETVTAQTEALMKLCDIADRVEIHVERSLDLFAQADIVTNLGFVRPIDAEAVASMKPTAVVLLMCEPWEMRRGDVDLDACRHKGIPVMGTNEDHPDLNVFAYSGWLCLKMLLEAQIEIHKSNILLVSGDKFGLSIGERLRECGVSVRQTASLCGMESIEDVDAIVVADYTRRDMIIGPEGDVNAAVLAAMAPKADVIQFAGCIDVPSLLRRGIPVHPGVELGPHRMAKTLAGLGPRPVVELHAAGLRVGQAALLGQSIGYAERIP